MLYCHDEKIDFCEGFTAEQVADHDEMLAGMYDDIIIDGITFTADNILFNCDPIAYRQSLMNYFDSIDYDEGEQ